MIERQPTVNRAHTILPCNGESTIRRPIITGPCACKCCHPSRVDWFQQHASQFVLCLHIASTCQTDKQAGAYRHRFYFPYHLLHKLSVFGSLEHVADVRRKSVRRSAECYVTRSCKANGTMLHTGIHGANA